MARRLVVMLGLAMGIGAVLAAGFCAAADALTAQAVGVKSVRVRPTSFNPARGERVAIEYELPTPARVRMTIYDPDGGKVCTLVEDQERKAGRHEETWDGKDAAGQVVPDEAYFFTVIARDQEGKEAVYDPSASATGECRDLTVVRWDPEDRAVIYVLPVDARVRIRLGITGGGPLLRTLVDWEPRVAGECTEFWNGKDRDGFFELHKEAKFGMVVSYMPLPQNSIITVGNKKLTYAEYKTQAGKGPPEKSQAARKPPADPRSPNHFYQPRYLDRDPAVRLVFPELEKEQKADPPRLSGRALVRVELTDQHQRQYLSDQQYEIVFFVDKVFYAEAEEGHSPYNWVWDLSKVPEGEHVLTVNITSFRDQVGIASRRILVAKEKTAAKGND